MKFIENIEKEKYMAFHAKVHGHFMQSFEWGQVNIEGRNQIPHLIGLEDESGLKCAALLLEKKGPFGLSYFYCPRGFIIDYDNRDLLKEFTMHLRSFLKNHKGIYLKVDPEISYHEIDQDAKPITNGKNNYDLYKYFLSIGYRHTGFTKLFDNNQPRYTFLLDLERPLEEIEKGFSKSLWNEIKKTYSYQFEFKESNDVETFHKLNSMVGNKDGFEAFSLGYYQNVYDKLYRSGMCKLFELEMNPKQAYEEKMELLKKLEDDKLKLKSEAKQQHVQFQIDRAIKESSILEPFKEEEKKIICSMMIAIDNDRVFILYIGNDDLGTKLYAPKRMYYEVLKYAKEEGKKYLDLFGTTGDPKTSFHNLAGIHKYKKSFGGVYTEWIGEFDLVNKKVLYRVLPVFLKIYRSIIKFLKRR